VTAPHTQTIHCQKNIFEQVEDFLCKIRYIMTDFNSVVHPKLFLPDPDPTLSLISNPDSNPDPACLLNIH
jgi:hypothetical protein